MLLRALTVYDKDPSFFFPSPSPSLTTTMSTLPSQPTLTLCNLPVNPFSSSVTTIVNIKLDRTNYLVWLAQILPILKIRDLLGYVDGTTVCPLKNLPGNTDVMILSWINVSLAASVLSVVASKHTARATWETLEQRYLRIGYFFCKMNTL